MTVTKRPDPLPHDAKVRPGRALGVEVESHAGACDVTRQIEELHLVAHLASSEPRGSGVLERTLKPKRCWGRSRRFIPCRARHARPHLVGARRDLHTAALHLVELQVAGIINLLVRGMFAVPRRWHFLLLPQPAQLVQDNLLRAPHVLLLGTRDNEKTFVILHGRVCVLAPLAKVRRCLAHELSVETGLEHYLHDELFPLPLAKLRRGRSAGRRRGPLVFLRSEVRCRRRHRCCRRKLGAPPAAPVPPHPHAAAPRGDCA
mmetsp:Transcript_80818/g.261073  ORF Transcript_80818/g.261073 Transcript_80818/m.261073 type:complete len:260 (-) Transcript_80818:173-952(-)